MRTVSRPRSSSTSPIATFAPASIISRAVSAPIPRAAPDINATLPSSRFIAHHLLSTPQKATVARAPHPPSPAGWAPPSPRKRGEGLSTPSPRLRGEGWGEGYSWTGGLSFLIRNRGFEVLEPDLGDGVGGGAPVAARREGAAGRDFRAVGQGRPLELAELEEAVEEDPQPLFDFGKGGGAL